MSIMAYQSYSCSNVSGIVLNPGYYALCECIVTGRSSCDVLYRWCGLEKRKMGKSFTKKTREYVVVNVDRLRQVKEQRFLSYNDLAGMAGTSPYPFWKMLCRNNSGKMWPGFLRLLEQKLHLKTGELELRNDTAKAC